MVDCVKNTRILIFLSLTNVYKRLVYIHLALSAFRATGPVRKAMSTAPEKVHWNTPYRKLAFQMLQTYILENLSLLFPLSSHLPSRYSIFRV